MKILLTNYALRKFTGSEINTIQIANELINMNHDVYIFTFLYQDPIKSYIKDNMRNIKIVNRDNINDLGEFDLIWAHQQPTLNYLLFGTNIKSKKIIYSCLSPYEGIESPPEYTNYLSLCLANSEETKNRLLNLKVLDNTLFLLKNFITDDFYNTNKNIDLFSPKKICVVSNHVPDEILQAADILKKNKIEVDIYGINHNFKMITPDILSNYDAIITIGKTVIYSLSMGIPVYCYDRFAGPGWITKSNFYKSQEYNFSGRCSNIKRCAEEIATEITNNYRPALNDTKLYLKGIIKKNNLLSSNINKILDTINSKENVNIDLIRSRFKETIENKPIDQYPKNGILYFNNIDPDIKLKFTSIIILTYNQLAYTKLCIESIKKLTPDNSYEIIVVDNNSTDGTVDWLKSQTDLKVILNSENKGFPAGCNQGIKISKGDAILLLNNDAIVTPNWLYNMQKALYSSDDIGAVGPVSNSCSNYQQIKGSYNNLEEMFEFAYNYNVSNENLWKFKTKLIGFCYLIKKEVIDKVGLLDERFTPGNFEDDDYSYRILCNGYKLLLCGDTFIHHFGSASFGSFSQDYLNIYNKNNTKFKEKWGFDSSTNTIIKNDFIDLINEPDKSKNLNILYVKCGIGTTLLEIKNIYKNANIYGIETCTKSADVAKNIFNCIVKDIEIDELPYSKHYFDYIIFDDIIEHLSNPWKAMDDFKKYLTQNGYIITCIPNIMHVSILSKLLNGSFAYADLGILDKTHLRFFTLSEINDLFTSTNYNIVHSVASVSTLEKDEEEFVNSLCNLYGEDYRQQYMTYQYFIKAKPNSSLTELKNEDLLKLRKSLLNLDLNIELDASLNTLFELFDIYKESFEYHLNYLIKNTIINKSDVFNTISNKAKSKNLKLNINL